MSESQHILFPILTKDAQPRRFIEVLRHRHELAQLNDKLAIVEKNQTVTYHQLWERVDELQTDFANVGIQKGDVVAICSPNSISICITFLALWQYGAIPFIINYKLETLGNLCDLNIQYYLVPNNNASVHRYFKSFDHFKQTNLHEGIECYINQYVNTKKLKDTAFLATSSGSSGKAKIVKLTEQGTLFNVKSNCKALSIATNDVSALILPLGYSYGLVAQFLSHLYMGASLVILDTVFFFTQIGQILNHFKVTNLFMVPPMIRQINYLYSKKMLQIDCPSLKFLTIGGNRIETSSITKVMDIFKCKVVKTYGLAEAGPRVATNIVSNPEHPNVESVGRANQGVEIEIVAQKNPDSQGVGVIKIHSPSVMSGYFNVRKPTNVVPFKSVITKDLGYVDTEGNLFILGRKDNHFSIDKQSFWYRDIENLLYKNFPFLKISIQKVRYSITIKVVAMYDFIIDLEKVNQVLVENFGAKAKKMFKIEVLKTNAMLNEK
ncbi:MAG: acyl--CoA ligase [Arcicella sp.]|jgi:acyl-CoA synthetase (AMP-forming)/AMP-acid ligase II|nr:acyl--CoA ligase [Arcicella sp.]